MDPFLAIAQDGLNALIHQLWSIAQRRQAKSGFPLKIIDDPETVRAIFNDSDAFKKNYAFLDAFSQGRFSANSESWSVRSQLTQPQYSKNIFLKHSDSVATFYDNAFDELNEKSSLNDVGEAVVAAAVNIVSRVFGSNCGIPWDVPWATRVRNALVKRQWIGFAGSSQMQLDEVDSELILLRDECAKKWKESSSVTALLERFALNGEHIHGFDPVQELIQNIIASSETTAATVMWAATILACRPDLQKGLRTETVKLDNFVSELLRLYPPVPFVTRHVEKEVTAGNDNFKPGEAIIVSILGLHYSNFWENPQVFDQTRFNQDICLRDHYMPFLIGPRTCGGRKLAELELKIAIPILLRKFSMSVDNPATVSAEYGLSFRPRADSFALEKYAS